MDHLLINSIMLNTIVMFDDEPQLKDIIYLNIPELSHEEHVN